MPVGVVGEGPAVEAVRAVLSDGDAGAASIGVEGLVAVDLGVVAGTVGTDVFERADAAARAGTTPWLAVELGGVGGHARSAVDAAVSGFGPGTGCYACLRERVSATDDLETGSADVDASTARLAGAIAGHEVAGLLAAEEPSVLGDVIELPFARRRFLPVPNCECAGDRDRSLGSDDGTRELDDALSRAERALDERVGIVREVGEVDSYPAPYYLARACETAGFSDASASREAAGVAAGWNRAFMKALGEALERYSAGVYRTDEFETAPAAELADAVPPSAFVLPPGTEPRADEAIDWVPGEELASRRAVRLPAEFVQYPPPSERHAPAITTGLGLGNSTVGALLSGLYEVVERDATMLAWYSTMEPLGLAVRDDAFAELSKRARSEGLSIETVLLTEDLDIPVVGVAVHRDGWPRFAAGSGANLDPVAAAGSALAEAVQNWMELRSMGPEDAADAGGAIGRYAEDPAEALAWIDVDDGFPAGSVGPAEAPAGAAELDAVLERLSESGLTAYGARVTPRDVEILGFEAVRVLVPGAQPLFLDEPFFGERARTVPGELGFEPRLDRAHHPFP